MENKQHSYWKDFSRLHEEALKYTTRSSFKALSSGAYQAARRDGLLDKICKHMQSIGTHKRRMIYSYEFSDNHVYVGLTYNLEKRKQEHTSSQSQTAVGIYIKKNVSIPTLITHSDYIDIADAISLEETVLKKYEKEGWILLNVAPTGAVGGNTLKWDYGSMEAEALKYQTKSAFKAGSSGAYQAAKRSGLLELICQHMKVMKIKWNKESAYIEATRYTTKKEFKDKSPSCHAYCKRNKILAEVCNHLTQAKKKSLIWDYERVKNEALKYESKAMFKKESYSAYNYAKNQKILIDICTHMKPLHTNLQSNLDGYQVE